MSSVPRPRFSRAIQVSLRSVHLVGMGLYLGGAAFGASAQQLELPLWLAAGSGLALLLAMAGWGLLGLTEGAGWALWLKLGLLGAALGLPSHRVELLVAATLVSSVGSHMPAAWRHWPRREGVR